MLQNCQKKDTLFQTFAALFQTFATLFQTFAPPPLQKFGIGLQIFLVISSLEQQDLVQNDHNAKVVNLRHTCSNCELAL